MEKTNNIKNKNNILLSKLEQNSTTLYKDVDLNSLFNFNYNFDLLKGIIGALLKNQQSLESKIEHANYVNNEQDKTIEALRKEIDEIKKNSILKEDFTKAQAQIKQINDMYNPSANEESQSK